MSPYDKGVLNKYIILTRTNTQIRNNCVTIIYKYFSQVGTKPETHNVTANNLATAWNGSSFKLVQLIP